MSGDRGTDERRWLIHEVEAPLTPFHVFDTCCDRVKAYERAEPRVTVF